MSDKPYADADKLSTLHWDEEMTYEQMGDELGCSSSTIGNWMEKLGVDRRPPEGEVNPVLKDEDDLRRLYVEEEMTCSEIATDLGCSDRAVLNWLEKHEIDRRKATPRDRSWKLEEEWHDEQILTDLYIEKGLTQSEIADRLGCSRSAVSASLRRIGIDTRDAADYELNGPACYHLSGGTYPQWSSKVDNERDVVRVHQLLAIAAGESPHIVFSPDTHIHHIGHIPWDNRESNITVLKDGVHSKLHHNLDSLDLDYMSCFEFTSLANTLYNSSGPDDEHLFKSAADAIGGAL